MRFAMFHIALLIVVGLVSCDKAPRGVIGERKMAELMEDFLKADAYMDMHRDVYDTDSMRQLMKQSIMLKHGVTQELYDTSLVWYAHNMDAYTAVYDRVIGSLDKEREHAQRQANKTAGAGASHRIQNVQVRHDFSASGDTIDIWQKQRTWLIPPALGSGYITFSLEPDERYEVGDRYEMSFKSISVKSNIKLLLAVDYVDGGTAFMSRGNCPDGWSKLMLQSDSTRTVRRIYGYLRYENRDGGLAAIDSLALLRMHKKDDSYGYIGVQRLLERNHGHKDSDDEAPEPHHPRVP